MTDHLADVKKYSSSVNEAAVKKLEKNLALVLRKADARYVALSDPEEVTRVRNNFLKKKLGLTQPDAELDAAIKSVAEKMKGARTKSRLTVYYLQAEHFGKLTAFG